MVMKQAVDAQLETYTRRCTARDAEILENKERLAQKEAEIARINDMMIADKRILEQQTLRMKSVEDQAARNDEVAAKLASLEVELTTRMELSASKLAEAQKLSTRNDKASALQETHNLDIQGRQRSCSLKEKQLIEREEQLEDLKNKLESERRKLEASFRSQLADRQSDFDMRIAEMEATVKRTERRYQSQEKALETKFNFEIREKEAVLREAEDEMTRKLARNEEKVKESHLELTRRQNEFKTKEKEYQAKLELAAVRCATLEADFETRYEKLKQTHADELRHARREMESARACSVIDSSTSTASLSQRGVGTSNNDAPPLRASALASMKSLRAPGSDFKRSGRGSFDQNKELSNMVAFAASLLEST